MIPVDLGVAGTSAEHILSRGGAFHRARLFRSFTSFSSGFQEFDLWPIGCHSGCITAGSVPTGPEEEQRPDAPSPAFGLDGELLAAQDMPREIEELRQRIAEQLQPGGPDVDYAALHLLIADKLDEDQNREIRRMILNWTSWNAAFREIVTALYSDRKAR